MAKQHHRRSTTRANIINAAKELFEKQGFEGTSIEQIVNQANVAKGTYYLHFKTKIEVLMATSQADLVQKFTDAKAALELNAHPLLILDQLIIDLCRWYEAHAGVAEAVILANLKPQLNVENQPSTWEVVEVIIKYAQKLGYIRTAVTPTQLAQLIVGTMAITILEWSSNPLPDVLFKRIKAHLDLILEGAGIPN